MIYFKKLLLLIFLLGLNTVVAGQDESTSLDVLLDRLLAGDQEVIPTLLEQKEEVLRLWRQRIKPDDQEITPLLKRLGDESYRERMKAVEKLSEMGSGIRGQVLAFKKANRGDPEISFRTQQVLEIFREMEKSISGVAVVKFLTACGGVDPAIILNAKDSYQSVFDEKHPSIFQHRRQMDNPETFNNYVRQYLQIPGKRKPFIDWLLQDTDNQRTVRTLRLLFQEDFKSTFALTYRPTRYSNNIDRLFEKEFSDRMTENEIWARVKLKDDIARAPSDREFDPTQPVTPEMAFLIMNRQETDRLMDHEFDLLFKKLSPMPKEELLNRIEKKPIETSFMWHLAKRRPDLHTELEKIILAQLEGIKDVSTWRNYILAALIVLKIELEPGQLDAAWIQLIESEKDYRKWGVWRGYDYRISPSVILPYLKKQKSIIQAGPSLFDNVMAHLLESDDEEIRRETVDLIQTTYLRDNNTHSNPLKIWIAALKYPETDNPGLAEKKLNMLGFICRHNYFFIKDMIEDGLPDRLIERSERFYNAHQSLVHQMFEAEELSGPAFVFIYLLSSSSTRTEETTRILQSTFLTFLRDGNAADRERYSALKVAFDFEMRDIGWLDAFVEHEGNARNKIFNSFLWRLDSRYRVWLPVIKQRLAEGKPGTILYLCTGILIDPDLPLWESEIDKVLKGNKGPDEIALLIKTLSVVNREPDLSRLPAERLETLFDASTYNAYSNTRRLIEVIQRSGNKRVALHYLQKDLKKVMGYRFSGEILNNLYSLFPESWDIVGETLLELVESGNEETATKAATSLSFMDVTPVSILPRIHALIKNPQTPSDVTASLFRLMARKGQAASELTGTIRDYKPPREWVEIRKAALASISRDAEERLVNLLYLQEKYNLDPNRDTLQVIGLISGFNAERLTFFKAVLEEGLSRRRKRTRVYWLRKIIHALPNLYDPEIVTDVYKDSLIQLTEPSLTRPERIFLVDHIFENLVLCYPNRLPEFKPVIEALPNQCKASWQYRMIMERMNKSPAP